MSRNVELRGDIRRQTGKAVLFHVSVAQPAAVPPGARGLRAWFPMWCTSLRRKDGYAYLTVPQDLLLTKIAEAERQTGKGNEIKESWVA